MISRELAQWIQSAWQESVEIVDVQPLIGGISSSMYRVDICNCASDEVNSFVLRAVLPSDGLNEDEGILAQEAAVLKQLAELSDSESSDELVMLGDLEQLEQLTTLSDSAPPEQLQAGTNAEQQVSFPRCIAYDASGEFAGVPALLMTYVQGKVSLPSEPTHSWLQELARAISPVHRATAYDTVVPWKYFRYAADGLDQHPALTWSKHPERWAAIIEHVSGDEPSFVPCLIHRDYHPTNILWDDQQQRVLSIVDWVNGCVGPAGIDVGHCRSNLVQLYGLQAANLFLEAYMQANPSFCYDPYWDICCLLDMTFYGPIEVYKGWTMLGFQGLTAEVIQQRIEQYVEDLVQLLHTNRAV